MTNNNNDQPLSCRVNARGVLCLGCDRRAVITLEWFSNIVMTPSSLALLNSRQPQEEQVVGKEMFTLCLYCLRRERYVPVWDNAAKLPRWEAVETLVGDVGPPETYAPG